MSWSERDIQTVLEEVTRRASEDAEFRSLALADAKAAIAKITPTPIPDDFKVRCVDGTGAHLTIVLPELRTADRELSDNELELVSGGGGALKLQPSSASLVFRSPSLFRTGL